MRHLYFSTACEDHLKQAQRSKDFYINYSMCKAVVLKGLIKRVEKMQKQG
jgi:hypothetical protein|tara:strand:- start:45 stop:194 length:150 start_codon:yes stop_codon:yes gene_type:complete